MRSRTFLKLLRAVLWTALIVWIGVGIIRGWRTTAELLALKSSGKYVNAQVIGSEPMSAGARMGYVHYAFNDGTRAIDNKMPVPVAAYSDFTIGKAIPVTYLPAEPHVVRIGTVDGARVAWSAVTAIIFIVVGLIAFGLPLLAIAATISPRKMASS